MVVEKWHRAAAQASNLSCRPVIKWHSVELRVVAVPFLLHGLVRAWLPRTRICLSRGTRGAGLMSPFVFGIRDGNCGFTAGLKMSDCSLHPHSGLLYAWEDDTSLLMFLKIDGEGYLSLSLGEEGAQMELGARKGVRRCFDSPI